MIRVHHVIISCAPAEMISAGLSWNIQIITSILSKSSDAEMLQFSLITPGDTKFG